MTQSRVIAGVRDVLVQGLELLSQVDDSTYAKMVAEPFGASIGGHYRHVLDHFFCLLSGLQSGVVDYDHRSRDRELETHLQSARAATNALIRAFQEIPAAFFTRECVVNYSVAYSDPASLPLASTIGREAAFCVGHAVHHFAIIRLLCAHFELAVAQDFGVAPSTLAHRAAMQAS